MIRPIRGRRGDRTVRTRTDGTVSMTQWMGEKTPFPLWILVITLTGSTPHTALVLRCFVACPLPAARLPHPRTWSDESKMSVSRDVKKAQ